MSLPSFQAAEATWRFHVSKAHLTDPNNQTACHRTLENSDPPTPEWDGVSHRCKNCVKYEQRQKEKNEPKYDPLSSPFGADSFYSEYCREFSGPGAER